MNHLVNLDDYGITLYENGDDSKFLVALCYEDVCSRKGSCDTPPSSHALKDAFFDVVESRCVSYIYLGSSRLPVNQFTSSMAAFEFMLLELRCEFINSKDVHCNDSNNVLLREFLSEGEWTE